mmetsp:Transcript_4395/g.9157  ORF Transcript_4395/g.9157 Transcript_4395/m.9157 type:complete len:87 (+) Transcript_4395:376-636(+)
MVSAAPCRTPGAEKLGVNDRIRASKVEPVDRAVGSAKRIFLPGSWEVNILWAPATFCSSGDKRVVDKQVDVEECAAGPTLVLMSVA